MSMGISGLGGAGGAHAVSGASSYAAPPAKKMANLFSQIDSSGSGSINQSQFTQAFNTLNPPGVFKKQGASAIFSKLDPKNSGSVSKQDFVQTMAGLMQSLRGGGSSATSATATAAPTSAASPASTLASSLRSLRSGFRTG